MKLNKNERFTLKKIVQDPSISNTEIANELNITTQAVGKIRKNLELKNIIKGYDVRLDYEKLGMKLFAIVLIKVLPKAFKKFSEKKINSLLRPSNVIESYAIPKTNVTHIMMYAFRNIGEYDRYFKLLLTNLGEYIAIKNTYVFSSNSIIKSSSKDLFLQVLGEYDRPTLHEPEIIDEFN